MQNQNAAAAEERAAYPEGQVWHQLGAGKQQAAGSGQECVTAAAADRQPVQEWEMLVWVVRPAGPSLH